MKNDFFSTLSPPKRRLPSVSDENVIRMIRGTQCATNLLWGELLDVMPVTKVDRICLYNLVYQKAPGLLGPGVCVEAKEHYSKDPTVPNDEDEAGPVNLVIMHEQRSFAKTSSDASRIEFFLGVAEEYEHSNGLKWGTGTSIGPEGILQSVFVVQFASGCIVRFMWNADPAAAPSRPATALIKQ